MKKTFRFLSMAALAFVGAVMTGCSSDDNIIDTPQQLANNGKTVTLTMSVGLNGGGETRALAADGTKTFAAGETMAVIYKKTGGATAMAETEALVGNGDITNNGKTATFTVTLEDPDKTQNVTYVYPAAMANSDGSINYAALNSQNGTLATLSSSLDLATSPATAWNGNNLPSVTLENQLAILAITLKNNAATPAEITSSITGMTISDGTNTYTVSPSSLSTIYVAIRPTTSANIDITANDGSQCYNKSLTGKTYAAGNGYNVSWRMAPAALNLTSPAVGQVIGNDGKNYAAGSLPGGVTAVAKICYVSGSDGLALALEDEGTMNWSTAISTCAAHTPAFTNGTWKLATQDEWNNMITAAGSFTALRDGFSGITGASNLLSNYYWSSTEFDSSNARICGFYYSDWGYDDKDKVYVSVRACLAWTQAAVAPKAAAEATAEDKGKLIGTDGKIYADVAAATARGTTAVAKIIYIGTTGHATYSHGLALALTDEGKMAWEAAKTACNNKNTSTRVTNATWLLASKAQWNNMITAAGGYDLGLESGVYWSSTENENNSWYASSYNTVLGSWNDEEHKAYEEVRVRACLAF